MSDSGYALAISLFLTAALALAGGVALTLPAAMEAADQRLVYWLDDAYIHLSMAYNVARHGVYGVTPGEFASASSSPLWVLLLAPFTLIVGSVSAFVLTGLSALLLIAVAARTLAVSTPERGRQRAASIGVFALLATVAPLPLMFAGMEHLLHAALMVAACWRVAARLGDGGAKSDAMTFALLGVLPLVRFESLWLVALTVPLALWRGKRGFALGALVCGLAPAAAFAAWSMAHGWPPLPMSILAKTLYNADPIGAHGLLWPVKFFLWWPVKRLALYAPFLFALMAGAAVMLAAGRRLVPDPLGRSWYVALLLFLAGSWIHATFGAFGWGGRYEAYLIALGCVFLPVAAAFLVLAHGALDTQPRRWIGGLLALALFVPAVERAVGQNGGIPPAGRTVYLRDVWAGQFLRDAFPRGAGPSLLAMNIGAVTWYGQPRQLTDVYALGDIETARLLAARALKPEAVRALAERRGVDVALIFDADWATWVGGTPPFLKVGTATSDAEGVPVVLTLYARDAATARRLAAEATRFQERLSQRNRVALQAGVRLEIDPAWR